MEQEKLEEIIKRMEEQATECENAAKTKHPYKNGKSCYRSLVYRESWRMVAYELRFYVKKLKGLMIQEKEKAQ